MYLIPFHYSILHILSFVSQLRMLLLLLSLPSVLALPQNYWDPFGNLALPIYNASGAFFSLAQQSACRSPGRLLLSDQAGSMSAEPANPFGDSTYPDAIFVQSLSIGTPARKIKLQMDTGSWQL